MSTLMRLVLSAVLLLTLLGPAQFTSLAQAPQPATDTEQSTDTAPVPTRVPEPRPTTLPEGPSEDAGTSPVVQVEPVSFTAAEVERLTVLQTANESAYGPDRNDPDEGIPVHAYSPFDEADPEPACSGAGCDHMPGVVLIKLGDGVQVASPVGGVAAGASALTDSAAVNDALAAVGVASLSPVFPDASAPKVGAMVEDSEGQLVAVPDLTRWQRAELVAASDSDAIDLTGAIEALVAQDGITWAEPDYVRRPIGTVEELTLPQAALTETATNDVAGQAEYNDPLYAQQWHLAGANVPAAWDYLESQGLPRGGSSDVVVAVIDTGVDYTHPDLAANMWVNAAEFNGTPGVDDDGNGYVDDIHGATTVSGQQSGDPQDDHGHGTHVAGIVAAQANNGIGGVGVAYNARIMAIKAAQYSGVLSSSDIAAAIYYAVDKGADVINMSFGGYARSTVEEDALTTAFGSAVLVAAAGNDGITNWPCTVPDPTNMYPAAYNWVLGTMASKQNQDGNTWLAQFSNRDCTPHDTYEYELMAPGVAVFSTLPGDQYAAWSGTSMAAPVVSGIAALARTRWTDKDVYSSRFIMGQIASNTMDGTGGRADAGAAVSQVPRPALSYLQHWLFDTAAQSEVNDDDGIVDAGETVDLAIVIRNHWGKADPVTVTLEPWAEGAVSPDPFVTMITDTVDYGAIGSFNWDDNGLVYDAEGVITGVQHPFRFSVAADCPNDHIIPFRLTMTAGNGYDQADPSSPYAYISFIFLIVQRGATLPGTISNDMVLSGDRLWIIERPTLIKAGTSVTVTAGTQIQFWSADPTDPYADEVASYLQVEGALSLQGTDAEPVDLFNSALRVGYAVKVQESGGGTVTFLHARVQNPLIGRFANDVSTTLAGPIQSIDHSYFSQDSGTVLFLVPGQLQSTAPAVWAQSGSYSRYHRLGWAWNPLRVSGQIVGNLYDSTYTITHGNWYVAGDDPQGSANVFLEGYMHEGDPAVASQMGSAGHVTYDPEYALLLALDQYDGHTYAALSTLQMSISMAESFAQSMGGHVVTIGSSEEQLYLQSYRDEFIYGDIGAMYPELDCDKVNCGQLFNRPPWLGLNDIDGDGVYSWISGEPTTYECWCALPVPGSGSLLVELDGACWRAQENWPQDLEDRGLWLLELPGGVNEADVSASRTDFLSSGAPNLFAGNAFLNAWWDPDPSHWMRADAALGYPGRTEDPDDYYVYLSGNYWGGASQSLVGVAVIDYADDWTLPHVVTEPLLSEAPAAAYPFVVDVQLNTSSLDHAGSAFSAPVVGAEPVTFTVTFNRDMDPTVQPTVSFGPDTPLTDYTVHPIDGGWVDARTWEGTFDVNPVTGDGYQLIRVAGPARAADDPWLVIGDDAGRFRFEVITSGTEAMNLQANGGEGYVDLMWTQTDFDLLSGFHLYRSTSADGTYTRINDTIIPPETRTWRDTDVVPGQPYYYEFTVVKSDMTESDYSNVATGTPIDTIAPVVVHTPITSAAPGLALTLNADVTDNVAVHGVTLYFRTLGTSTYTSRAMTLTTGSRYSATLESSRVVSPGLEYYIEATDGISVARSGRADYPWQVIVVDRPVVTGVAPSRGPAGGGTSVTVSGSNFKAGAVVTFGGMAASDVEVLSSSQIACVTPAHYPTTVDVMVTNQDLQVGTLLRGYTFEADTASLGLPDTGGGQHAMVEVPVSAADVNGLAAASLTIQFDSTVLSAQSARTGSLTPGWSVVANTGTAGEVRLSMASPGGTVSGSGVLAYITFEVVGAPGATSALTLVSASLNDGAIPVETANGSFAVNMVYDVSGTVSFWSGGTGVPDVSMVLQGERLYAGTSGETGAYTVAGAAAGDYVLTPSKSDGTGGISAYDASLALQHDAGLVTLTGYQAVAGDVNRNGAVTAMDAFHILQRSVGLLELPFPGAGVVWLIDPATRTYTSLAASQTGQDFTGVLLGEISGNWAPGATGQGDVGSQAASATISVGDLDAVPGAQISVPVAVTLQEASLYGANLTVTYDPAVLTAVSVEKASLGADWLVAGNMSESGVIRIGLAGSQPVTTGLDLVNIIFDVVGAAGQSSAIGFGQAELNEGAIPTTTDAGSVTIYTAVAAAFSGSPLSGPAPLLVSFTNQSTGDHDTYAWTFGDGGSSTASSPSHSYTTPGVYTVSLTASGHGGSDTETRTDYMTVYAAAGADFSGTPLSGLAPLQVTFTSTSGGEISTYAWTFGDGGTSTAQNPVHTYTQAGSYTVSLTVDGAGGQDTETKTGYITVSLGSISGNVAYWSASRAVSDVALTTSGDAVLAGTSGATGAYAITGLYRGNYTVTATSTRSDDDAITPYDASLALRHSTGLATLTSNAATAADVTRNGTITAFDASYMLQRAVGLAELPLAGASSAWLFEPASRSYPSFSSNQTGQNYTATLLGDPSGNWHGSADPAVTAELPAVTLSVNTSAIDATGYYATTIDLAAGDTDMFSLYLDLAYDSQTELDSTEFGPEFASWLSAVNAGEGTARIAMAGATAVSGDQRLATFRFKAGGGAARLTVAEAEVDEGAARVVISYGTPEYRLYLPFTRR